VDNECELQHLWVSQVGNFHLEEVLSVVDEGDHVSFPRNGQRVVQDFIQNIMRKCSWSQKMVLGRFAHVFMVMYDGLEFLFDSIGDIGDEPDV